MQIVYKDVVIDVNLNLEVTEVECPISTHQTMNESNNANVGVFNVCTEGGFFISKSMFKPHLPQILIFDDVCVHRPWCQTY